MTEICEGMRAFGVKLNHPGLDKAPAKSTVVQKIEQTKKAFSVVASLVRIHLISLPDVYELLRSTRREYARKPKGPQGYEIQMKLKLM